MSALELEQVTKAWPSLSQTIRVPHSESDYHTLVELLDRLTDEVGQNEGHHPPL